MSAIEMTNVVNANLVSSQRLSSPSMGRAASASEGELLVAAILQHKVVPQIRYHSPLMGPMQTCYTCIVELDVQLVRSCGTTVGANMNVVTRSKRAKMGIET